MPKKKTPADANNLTPEPSAAPNTDESEASVNFEASLEELETLVEQMEAGDLTLDESLQAFERGITLTRQCQNALQQAQLRVQTLTEQGELVDIDLDELE